VIDRRTFVGVATGGLVAAALSVRAQQPDKVWRVGLLDPGIPHLFAAFRGAMRELGYIEGRNITFEVKSAQGERERTSAAAAELVALKPDAIVTASPLAIRAARSATATIPIIAVTGDAVATGLVTNLAQPEGNVTGLSFLNTELSAKRIEVFKEALPRLTKLAMLNDLSGAQSFAAATRPAAQRLGIQLQQIDVRRSGDLERAFGDAKRGGAEAIDVLASAYFNASRDEIVKLAAQSRLPAIYESREYVDAGGLMSYGQDLFALFRRSAYFLDKILKGTPIRDLPWEQPTNFQLVINLKTAKVLGLTIPQSLLLRANDVIQ
jgi:putative tryptophan/tyrosine transport system substrate-binding protein